MAKVYFLRHQAGNVITKYPFSQPPTDAQIAAVVAECVKAYGECHPKTPGEPYWIRLFEVDLLGPDDMPEGVTDAPVSTLSSGGDADVQKVSVSGTGYVTSAPSD